MIVEKPTGMKYITRCDYPRTHGWWVRIFDSRDGKGKVSKYFRDTKYESKEEGLIEAMKFRDKYFNRLTRAEKTITNGKSRKGKIYSEGVYISWKTRGEHSYPHATASWWEGGKQHRKTFSIEKYGYDEAWKKAKAVRQEMTKHKIKAY